MDSAMCNVRRWSSSFRQYIMWARERCVRVCLCTSLDVLFGIEKVRLDESRSCTFWILFCVVLCYLQKLAINVYIDICEYSCRDTNSLFSFFYLLRLLFRCLFACLFVCAWWRQAKNNSSSNTHTLAQKQSAKSIRLHLCAIFIHSRSFVLVFLFAISTLFSWHHQKKSEQQRAFDYDYQYNNI